MKYVILFIILALLGVYLLQEGITGMVVAEPTQVETSSFLINFILIFFGAKLILVFSFLIYKRSKKRQVTPLSKTFK